MNISIIGAGNVAWHISKELEEARHNLVEIYARDRKKAKELTYQLYQTDAVNSLDFSHSEAEVFIIAVSDNAIQSIAEEILLPANSVLIHTSGAIEMQVLEKAKVKNENLQIGVFYPLMTFSRFEKLDMSSTPLCIEGEEDFTKDTLFKLAKSLTSQVYEVTSYERSVLHLGAVFSCNFTNHLYALSKEILESENLDFDILKPLIKETVQKAFKATHPAEVQTGPAVRRDENTIKKHRKSIFDDKDLLKVYDVLTNSIQDWHEAN